MTNFQVGDFVWFDWLGTKLLGKICGVNYNVYAKAVVQYSIQGPNDIVHLCDLDQVYPIELTSYVLECMDFDLKGYYSKYKKGGLTIVTDCQNLSIKNIDPAVEVSYQNLIIYVHQLQQLLRSFNLDFVCLKQSQFV